MFQFWRLGELAAQEFDELARARPTVGTQQAHPVEKNQKVENLRVFEAAGGGTLDLLLFDFGEKRGHGGIEFARERRVRRLFVENAGGKQRARLDQL